jgi:hypothetical protein
MLIGPNGSPPVFVNVTDADAVEPTLTWPKSIAVVLIAMSVSTASTDPGTATVAAANPAIVIAMNPVRVVLRIGAAW